MQIQDSCICSYLLQIQEKNNKKNINTHTINAYVYTRLQTEVGVGDACVLSCAAMKAANNLFIYPLDKAIYAHECTAGGCQAGP